MTVVPAVPLPAARNNLVFAELWGRSRVKDAVWVTAGAAWVALLGQISIPLGFTPVPLSLGTFAVLTAGTALGATRGAAAMVLFLVAGWAGAPVFAGGHSGIGLPTTGYVLGYVAAAALAGRAARRGQDRSYSHTLVFILVASALVYALGVPYLALHSHLTLADGIGQGLWPFLPGDAIKAALATALIPSVWRMVGRRDER